MDQSFYTSYEVQVGEDQAEVHSFLEHLKIPLNVLGTVEPLYRAVKFYDNNGKLIAPVELYILRSSIILTVHPSAAEDILGQLHAIMPQT